MIRTAVCNFDNTNFRSPSRWFWLNYARRAFDACRWIIQEYVGGRALRDPDPDPAGFTNPELPTFGRGFKISGFRILNLFGIIFKMAPMYFVAKKPTRDVN
jgi:hypothetical protein